MWGKQDNFIGKEAFGEGEMKPREQKKPGTHYEYNDVRINRFALSLLRIFNKPVPDVFREQVMDVDRRLEHVAMDSVSQQLGRAERPQDGVGERRHPLGRRHVDQLIRHGALRLPVAAGRQVGRQAGSAAGVCEGGVDSGRRGQLPRQRLRLPVVAQHDGQGPAGAAEPTRFRPTAPAATPSRCRPTTTSSWCGAGTRAAPANSPGASLPPSSPGRCEALSREFSIPTLNS